MPTYNKPQPLFSRLGDLFRDALAVVMGLLDSRVPWYAKVSGLAALLYVISPVDLVPDVFPVVGWLDDLAVIPLAGYLVSRLIPVRLFGELRERADAKIMRWGPKVRYWALAAVLLWLLLAAAGFFFLIRDLRRGDPPAPSRPASVTTPPPSTGVR